MSEHYCMYKDGMCELDIDEAYQQGRADQKEEDNAFFSFEGAWELEKKKVRADVIDSIIRAEKNKYFCVEDLCTGAKDCSDCRVEYLEKLKEKDNG